MKTELNTLSQKRRIKLNYFVYYGQAMLLGSKNMYRRHLQSRIYNDQGINKFDWNINTFYGPDKANLQIDKAKIINYT